MANNFEIVIKPSVGWRAINWREMWLFRDLFFFLVWRDIKIRYRQTALGVAWALLQPLLLMLIFTVVFHRLGSIDSDGPPYPLFTYVGLIGWTFFTNAVSASSNSLVGNQQLVSKVYFPRLLIPLGAIGALVLDLLLSIVLGLPLLAYYDWPLSAAVFWMPLFIVGTFLAASGVGFILSALNVQFRDVKYVVPFLVQAGMFLTPVIYPVIYVPERYRLWVGLNPMAGMVEGFRFALLGTPVDWGVIGLSLTVSSILFVGGVFLFRRLERTFADVI